MIVDSKEENQKIVDVKYREYVNDQLSFDQYYLWLSEFVEIPGWMIPFSRDELLNSKDIHFNDLDIRKWDSRDFHVRKLAYLKIKVWSLNNTICCLKAMSRHLINRKLQD